MSCRKSKFTRAPRRTPAWVLPAVVGLGLIAGRAADGAVVYSSLKNIAIPNDFAGVTVDLELPQDPGDITNDLNGFADGDINLFLGGSAISNDAFASTTFTPTWQPVRTGSTNADPIRNLGLNTVVDGSTPVRTTAGAASHCGIRLMCIRSPSPIAMVWLPSSNRPRGPPCRGR